MAPLRAMRAAAPAMAERGWGRVVNVCSTAGKRPSAAMPEYSVAKAAELSLSRLFADRYAKQRRPRQRDLPRPDRIGDVDGARAACSTSPRRCRGAAQPRGGAGAQPAPSARSAASPSPAEIAAAIVFLCSERASYVSGAAWSVDGGTVQVII